MTPADTAPVDFDYTDPAFDRDPWSVYTALRRAGNVHRSAGLDALVVMSHEHVKSGLEMSSVGSDHPLRSSRRAFGRNMLDLDGPEHRRLRGVVAPGLGPKAVRRAREAAVEPIVDEAVAAIRPGSVVAAVDGLTSLIPFRLMCHVMGLPDADAAWLHRTMRPVAGILDYPPHGQDAIADAKAELGEYFERRLADGGARPDGLAAGMVRAMNEADPPFARTDVASTLILFVLGGTETSIAALTNVLHTVATVPRARELAVSGEPGGAEAMVREALRLQPPVHSVLRFAREPMEIDGVAVGRRRPVFFSLASANRDERVFEFPDRFDVRNAGRSILSFASGAHVCPGMGLALSEITYFARSVVRRFPRIAVVPGTTDFRGHSFRRPADLHVEALL